MRHPRVWHVLLAFALAFAALILLLPARPHRYDPLGIAGATLEAAPPEAESIYRALDRCVGHQRAVAFADIRWVETDTIPTRYADAIRPGLDVSQGWVPSAATALLRRDAIIYEPERVQVIAHVLTHARLRTRGHPAGAFTRACGNTGTYVFGVPDRGHR